MNATIKLLNAAVQLGGSGTGLAFAHPERLLLLAIPIALVVLTVISSRRRSAAALRFANTDMLVRVAPRVGFRRWVPVGLIVAGLVAGPVGLAHLQEKATGAEARRQVILAFDVSRSMAAEDVSPSRLAVAQAAAVQFVQAAPDDVYVGLVLFAGTIVDVVPPTQDRAAIEYAIESTELYAGTALGDAIATSVQILKGADGSGGGSVVLLSDGVSTQGMPVDQGIAIAQQAEVPVSTIAFGTQTGVVIIDGETIPVPSSPPELATIAEQTGGRSAVAEDANQLYSVFDTLAQTVEQVPQVRDYGDWFFALAIGCVAAAGFLSWWWFSRIV